MPKLPTACFHVFLFSHNQSEGSEVNMMFTGTGSHAPLPSRHRCSAPSCIVAQRFKGASSHHVLLRQAYFFVEACKEIVWKLPTSYTCQTSFFPSAGKSACLRFTGSCCFKRCAHKLPRQVTSLKPTQNGKRLSGFKLLGRCNQATKL